MTEEAKGRPLTSIPDDEYLGRGEVLRLPAAWPYESRVDFMLVDVPSHGAMTLVVSSGRKAGFVLIHLPEESKGDAGKAIPARWLKENWARWVYPECRPEDVIVARYQIPGASVPDMKRE